MPFFPKRDLRLGDHARKRRAQLVRELGREPLLAAKPGCESFEQPVKSSGKLADVHDEDEAGATQHAGLSNRACLCL